LPILPYFKNISIAISILKLLAQNNSRWRLIYDIKETANEDSSGIG
jgi:hypothetical protein